MGSVTRRDEKQMASDDPRERDEERPAWRTPEPKREGGGGGFFTVYKSGQGYWTRLGTAMAAGLIIALTIHFFWQNLRSWLVPAFTPVAATAEQVAEATTSARNITLGVCIAIGLGMGGLAWWMMNKPTNADFLIATDSEMKKVNWASRKDLIGSTKVVIGFMFLVAIFLFFMDVLFGYFFYFLDVLKTTPF
jgi:preprotein translocase subunit SecE